MVTPATAVETVQEETEDLQHQPPPADDAQTLFPADGDSVSGSFALDPPHVPLSSPSSTFRNESVSQMDDDVGDDRDSLEHDGGSFGVSGPVSCQGDGVECKSDSVSCGGDSFDLDGLGTSLDEAVAQTEADFWGLVAEHEAASANRHTH